MSAEAQVGKSLLDFLNTPVAIAALNETKTTVDAAMKTTLYVGISVVVSFGLNRIVSDTLDLINKTYVTKTNIDKYNEFVNNPVSDSQRNYKKTALHH